MKWKEVCSTILIADMSLGKVQRRSSDNMGPGSPATRCQPPCLDFLMIVMVTFDFLVQLYLLPERKRNRKKGYGRIVAERPTGSRAGCQSASGGSRTPRPVRTTVRPKPMSHHQKTPNKSHRRSC